MRRLFLKDPSLAPPRNAKVSLGGRGKVSWMVCLSFVKNMDSTWSFGPGLLVAGSISRVDKTIPSAGVSFKACRLGVS